MVFQTYCVDFTETLCSPALASFADAKLFDFQHSTFQGHAGTCIYGMHKG